MGSLSLSLYSLLQNHIHAARDVFGALVIREDDLLAIPNDTDFADLGFSGFVDGTVQELQGKIAEGGDGNAMARDALLLLLRLARGAT